MKRKSRQNIKNDCLATFEVEILANFDFYVCFLAAFTTLTVPLYVYSVANAASVSV